MPKPRRATVKDRIGIMRTPPRPKSTYVRGASGSTRPGPKDEYVIDGVAHTYDGKCHDGCVNVR